MPIDRTRAAILAQIMAQALTAWALLLHLTRFPDVSAIGLASLVAALGVPLRHDGSHQDRATCNFGAGILVSATLWWALIMGGVDYWNGLSPQLGMGALCMLVSAVLHSLAGAMFWTSREDAPR